MSFDLEEDEQTKVLLNRIMLIEEDAESVEVIKKLLTDKGFQVSGREMAVRRRERFGCIHPT